MNLPSWNTSMNTMKMSFTMSIRELSQAVSYSSATILRFCKKLGLSGFSELKFALRNEAEDPKQKTENIPILSNQSIIDTIETEVTGTANLIKNDHFRENHRSIGK